MFEACEGAYRGCRSRGDRLGAARMAGWLGTDHIDFLGELAVAAPHARAMLAEHGGRVERRLRSDDGCREIHILWFPDMPALGTFRADPRRQRVRHLFEASRARMELFAVEDVVHK